MTQPGEARSALRRLSGRIVFPQSAAFLTALPLFCLLAMTLSGKAYGRASDAIRIASRRNLICVFQLSASGALLTTQIAGVMPGATPTIHLAYAAAAVIFLVYVLGLIFSFLLPEPQKDELPE